MDYDCLKNVDYPMDIEPRPSEGQLSAKPKEGSVIWVFAKSAIAAGGVLCAIIFGSYFSPVFHYLHHRPADQVTEEPAGKSIASFKALSPMRLMTVPEEDVQSAIQTMELPSEARESLLAEVVGPNSVASQGASAPSVKSGSLDSHSHDKGMEASKAKEQELASNIKNHRLSLAWMSLWDTDAEDGYTVIRIGCQGYSRTVILNKAPVTFAVPFPKDGIVTIKCIRDGDGKGVTVGVGSGASRIVFPKMREGQVLSLRVKMN